MYVDFMCVCKKRPQSYKKYCTFANNFLEKCVFFLNIIAFVCFF